MTHLEISANFAYAFGALLLAVWLMFSYFKKFSLGRTIFISVYIIYITAVISITLFPIITDSDIAYAMGDPKIKLIPFSTIIPFLKYGGKDIIIPQIVGNIMMTIPFGVAAPILFRFKFRFWHYLLMALLFPLSIEVSQLCMDWIVGCYYRTFDVDDIILNFLGITIGYLFYSFLPDEFIQFFQ